jgi:hypothetical protein
MDASISPRLLGKVIEKRGTGKEGGYKVRK